MLSQTATALLLSDIVDVCRHLRSPSQTAVTQSIRLCPHGFADSISRDMSFGFGVVSVLPPLASQTPSAARVCRNILSGVGCSCVRPVASQTVSALGRLIRVGVRWDLRSSSQTASDEQSISRLSVCISLCSHLLSFVRWL